MRGFVSMVYPPEKINRVVSYVGGDSVHTMLQLEIYET